MLDEVCNLAKNKCIPCSGGVPPMTKGEINVFLKELGSCWVINDLGHLFKEFKFLDFMSAMRFANMVAEIAEQEGHHPNLNISCAICACEIWTHKIDGLTDSDFFLAAKIEILLSS